jgi:hypothetical protein
MRKIKSIAIFSLTFLAVVVFFEFFLSLCGILQPIVRIDPDKGERYRPDLTCSSLFVSEGFGLAKTNSEGWFGHDFKDMGKDDLSVAVIGNSFVASRQVFYRQNFLSLAEKKTNEILSYKKNPKTVSLFNFGKEDLPINELLFVKEDLDKLNHPDHFLILLNEGTFNLVSRRYVARYEFENGTFKVDTSFKQTPFVKNYQSFELFTKSSVLFLAHRVQGQLPDIWEIFFDKFYISSEKESAAEENHTTIADLSDSDIACVKELSKDKRVIFLLNFDPAVTGKIKSLIGESPYINIQPVLSDLKQRGIDPNYWEIPDKSGHFNLVGHKVVADEITKKMISLAIHN